MFSGGADLDAIEGVVDGELDVMQTLGTLVDSSLVIGVDSGLGEPRFVMLKTIHEFAAALLDARPMPTTCGVVTPTSTWLWRLRGASPHRPGPGRLAAAVRDGARQPGDGAAVDTRDRGNRARDGGGIRNVALLPTARASRRRKIVGGKTPGRPRRRPSRARAAAHLAAGNLAFWQADYGAMADHYQRALAMYEELGDKPGIAEATYDLAFVPVITSDEPFDRGFAGRPAHLIAMGRLEEALRLFEELG